jgi:hypothetical protein
MKIRIQYLLDDDRGSVTHGFDVGLTRAPVIFDHTKTVDLLHLGEGRRIVLVPEMILIQQEIRYLAGGFEFLINGAMGWSPALEEYIFEAARRTVDGRIRGLICPNLGDLPGTGGNTGPGDDRPAPANVTRKNGEGGGL